MRNYYYKCHTDDIINEIIDEVITWMGDGETVWVHFKGKLKLVICCEEGGLFFWIQTPDNHNVYMSDIYEANSPDTDDIREALTEALDFVNVDVRETGGNILTISGRTIDDNFFICDQYGDGFILDTKYDLDWSYEEFMRHVVGNIDERIKAYIDALLN